MGQVHRFKTKGFFHRVMPTHPRRADATGASHVALDPAALAFVQDELLSWFEVNARDLPWRQTRDPYRVLVAEIMLQQVQVERVIPFYRAFLDRFPTVEALAAAPIAEVIRVWGDLGRYRRLVNLHATARSIVSEFDGVFPRDPEVLRRLPGIDPYTAGAVACFAFEQDRGFLDTNIRRVLHRLFVGVDVPAPTATDRELLAIAEAAVPRGQAWSWNQALMDFGATRCTARRPACMECRVRTACRAYPAIEGALADLPRRANRSAPRYDGSNRYYRGRVLAELRGLPTAAGAEVGIPIHDLGARVREGFGAEDVPWLYGVVESLSRDGLAAVAEDAPAYDAGSSGTGEVRVKLP